MFRGRFCLVALLLASSAASGHAADPLPALPEEILVLPPVSRYGRNAVPVDPVQESIARGTWKAPVEGDTVPGVDRKDRAWMRARLKDGAIQHQALGGGYAYVPVASEKEQTVLLRAVGSVTTLVNGEPRAGDMYGNGSVLLPVRLRKGVNDLLFHVGRGSLRVKFEAASPEGQFHLGDLTLPDALIGQDLNAEAGVIVLNSLATARTDLTIEASVADGKPVLTPVPVILPLSLRKVPVRIRAAAPTMEGKLEVRLRLLRIVEGARTELDSQTISLDVKKPTEVHRRTFRSLIDGSIQYFALVPAKADGERKPGLVLTLHGASVEGLGQAACYAPKPGLHVVAPTNRRPYGFDWEDWGRRDAMEVLELAQRELETDPARTYLTGHSMGGHGTWHLGVTYPDRFAAIAPSAGWVSMWSYAGMKRQGDSGEADELIMRAANASDTLALSRNYAQQGIYVLHGSADDNVPVEQARTMRKVLAEFHTDFVYREEIGAGHWWGKEGISGAACVDWPPIFEFFAMRTLPDRRQVRTIDFVTASPGISATCHWVRIEAQTRPMLFSQVRLNRDVKTRRIEGTTENVARLTLNLDGLERGPVVVRLDGQTLDNIPWPKDGNSLTFDRRADAWLLAAPASSDVRKTPERSGPFKEAFSQRMLFVYGTRGTAEENAWAMSKARFDAEQFWYRGNGSIDVIADTAFDPAAEPNRSVILYGNSESNSAWARLLADSPIQVKRKAVHVGDRIEKGDDLAALFVRPRPGSQVALVGVVAGTGRTGLGLTDRIPYFVSGVGIPDWMVLGGEAFRTGMRGVRGAGYFGNDWSLETGESAWKD